MIYNNYKVKFYRDSQTGRKPAADYIKRQNPKDQTKIFKYIDYLQEKKGYLEEPYARHITGKIRELRIDFARNRHRIFYFTFIKKNIILLHAFLKKTQRTPSQEIERAKNNYQDTINNPHLYE